MRPGTKAQAVKAIRDAADKLVETANEIETAPSENLQTVGTGWWTDGRVSINIGDTYHLTIIEARVLVSRLVAAIYCAERSGNTEHPACEAKERAFLNILKRGLFHSLSEEQILEALKSLEEHKE